MEKIYQYLAGTNLLKAIGVHKTVMNTNGAIMYDFPHISSIASLSVVFAMRQSRRYEISTNLLNCLVYCKN